MNDSTDSEISEKSLSELLKLCLDRACMTTYHKTFREVESSLARVGTPLTSDEISALVVLGAALIANTEDESAL